MDSLHTSEAKVPSHRRLTIRNIWNILEKIPELGSWPEISDLLFTQSQYTEKISVDWHLPAIGYELLTGNAENVQPAIAAMSCTQIAIIIADDILDEEPGSLYQQIGAGRAANISMALYAAAHSVLDQCVVPDRALRSAHSALSRMVLATARGQDMDVQNLTSEEDYWRVVKAKSAPFYGTALEIGARLALADPQICAKFYAIGAAIGEMIQIQDDLDDAFSTPANPDWIQGRNNLAILYALSAEHNERGKLIEMRSAAENAATLDYLQQILIRSGAVSYCMYQTYERRNFVYQLLKSIPTQSFDLLEPMIEAMLEPTRQFAANFGGIDAVG